MVIEITRKQIIATCFGFILLVGSFIGGYFIGKSNTVPKEDYTTARQYAIYTSEMVKALHQEMGNPYISNVDFITNARAIATLKAKATGKSYQETKDSSYTISELLDVYSLLKE